MFCLNAPRIDLKSPKIFVARTRVVSLLMPSVTVNIFSRTHYSYLQRTRFLVYCRMHVFRHIFLSTLARTPLSEFSPFSALLFVNHEADCFAFFCLSISQIFSQFMKFISTSRSGHSHKLFTD